MMSMTERSTRRSGNHLSRMAVRSLSLSNVSTIANTLQYMKGLYKILQQSVSGEEKHRQKTQETREKATTESWTITDYINSQSCGSSSSRDHQRP